MFLSKIIETKSGNYVYDAINGKIKSIPKDVFNELKSGVCSEKYFKFIKENGCRDFTEQVEFNIKQMLYTDEEFKWFLSNAVNTISLCVTENCNLRCEYCCYMNKYQNVNYKLKNMSKKVALKAIDFLMQNSKNVNKVNVRFYGGEPFLNFNLIKDCVDYCKKKYPFKIPSFSVTTNGVLLYDSKIIDFIIENDFNLYVSMDGTKKSHNEHRIDKFKNVTFEKIISNLNKIYKRDPIFFKNKVGFNCIITPINYSKEQYDFLDNLCKSHVGISNVEVTEHFKKVLECKKKLHKIKKVDTSKYDFVQKNILWNMKFYHDHLRKATVVHDIFPGRYCIPIIKKAFVTTDGRIALCEKVDENNFTYILGDVFNGVDLNKIKKLFNYTVNNISKCKSCWASRLANFCFKDVFNLTDEYCKQCSESVYLNMKYYIEHIKDNKEIVIYLENLASI